MYLALISLPLALIIRNKTTRFHNFIISSGSYAAKAKLELPKPITFKIVHPNPKSVKPLFQTGSMFILCL